MPDEDIAATTQANAPAASADSAKVERREIKGGLPYTTSPGVLKKALELIVAAERPDKFTANYMATVLKLTGGGAKAVPPLLKKMNFIGADGTPTSLYSKFKTEGGRSQAAYEGLKHAFAELFKRNEYIHKADEASVKDTIVEITGLKKSDQVSRLIYTSFDAIRNFITNDVTAMLDGSRPESHNETSAHSGHNAELGQGIGLGLSYQINIVLPETENISVFNAIFRSLRDNLLR